MGLFKVILLKIILCFVLWNAAVLGDDNSSNYILYLMQNGNTAKSLQAYQEYCKEIQNYDFDLLQKLGLILLDQGFRSRDPEIQTLTLFGAGISLNEKALYILEESISSENPQLQLIALNFLSRFQNDEADIALNKAMNSNYLLIRLEAAFQLASKKSPQAVSQIESLMSKLDKEAVVVFPQLFGIIGDPASTKIMRKLLTHHQEDVRVEAILSLAEHGRDDLLPQLRRMASQYHAAQQEACAYALGILKDEASIPKLEVLAQNPNSCVKLAALQALYGLGRKEVRKIIEKMALEKDLYAISLLGQMEGSEQVLANLIKDFNIQVRINAAIALLELKDARCLIPLCEVLIRDVRDIVLLQMGSQGKSLSCWRAASSASENFKDSIAFELSLSLREELLTKTMELPEKDFLQLANTLFELNQNDLVPLLTSLLENLQTPGAIELLKKHQQKAGAPLVRNYCNLSLYRIKEPGPYSENLRDWVTKQQNIDLIRFRPIKTWDMKDYSRGNFELTPQETSRLLVEAFESYIQTQDDKGIDVLISVLQNGNPKNKYALIGLLMRAAQ